jgi:hypothetical protein
LQQFIQVEKKLFISEKMRKSYKSVRSMANYGTVRVVPCGPLTEELRNTFVARKILWENL